MSAPSPKKVRNQRVAGRDPVPKRSAKLWQTVLRSDVLLRIGMCLMAAVIMALATSAWAPPFGFREGDTPSRNVVARVDFSIPNPRAEDLAREAARSEARHVYVNNPRPLGELRGQLRDAVAVLLEAQKFDEKAAQTWQQFVPRPEPDASLTEEENLRREQKWQRQFENFRLALANDGRLRFDTAVERAVGELEKHGLFEKPDDDAKYPGNRLEVIVYPEKDWNARKPVEVKEIQITYAKPKLRESLTRELQTLQKEVENRVRSETRQTFVHNPQPLKELVTRLQEKVGGLIEAADYDEETAKIWMEFLPLEDADVALPTKEVQQQQFEQFRQSIPDEESLASLKAAIEKVLDEYQKRGLLLALKGSDEAPEGHQEEIYVVMPDDADARQTVQVKDVRLDDVKGRLREQLEKELKSLELAGRIFAWLERQLPGAVTLKYRPAANGESGYNVVLADAAYDWLHKQLPTTLTLDPARSEEMQDQAAAAVDVAELATKYHFGEDVVAASDQPLDKPAIDRLYAEYNVILDRLTPAQMLGRAAAILGMYLALYTLCGLFMYFRFPELLDDTRRFAGLLLLTLTTVIVCYIADNWKAELIPLLLFGMTVAIAYRQELALLLAAAVALVVVLSLGHGLASFVILTAATATAVLLLGRVRSRVKLVYVGICSGLVASLTTIGVNIVSGRVMDWSLLTDAGLFGLWGVAAGFAMTGLLPFIEQMFGILTDISLLELGDVAHPLLQELVRRAPGTYNHSINVASMAQAAAESIQARGLLVRVGAYFHDIGKMLKPQYFIENQGQGDNLHESLVPAMSTLVIIAHVKDGAELAREHHLPQPIIDFVQQHHGTTLVEYFYRRASEDSERDPNAVEVDENTFRYPGPKPQTKEAGILMLADAVESASRVLVEPTPSRIESLVDELAMKRLLDGQLDESGLTLQEVRTVQESLVKSLTAVYHGRVKYPDQMTA